MSQNVEQFLLQFVFEDKKVVKQVKQLANNLDKVTSSTAKKARVSKRAAQSEETQQRKLNALDRKRLELKKAIDKYGDLGLNVRGYKTTLANATKLSTLDKRLIELKKQGYALERKISAEKARQVSLSAKAQSTSVRKANKPQIAGQFSKVGSFQKGFRTKTDVADRLQEVRDSAKFQYLMKKDARAASAILNTMEKELNEFSTTGVRAFKRLKYQIGSTTTKLKAQERATFSLKTAQRGLSDSTRHMIRSYASLYAVIGATNAINKTGQEFEALNSAMLAAMGSTEAAQAEISYLDKLTSRLGLSLLDTADQYTKFTFAAKGKMPTSEVRALFEGVAEAGTVLGVSRERMKLSFNAIQQMLNKTTVTSEELKRQLAESFPGAIQIFARSIGKSEQEMFKMMENGELLAADVLPKVAIEMKKVANTAGALEAKYKTARVAQGRFFKQLESARKGVFFAGFDEGAGEFFNTLATVLEDSEDGLEGLGKTFKAVFHALSTAVRFVTPILNSFLFVIGEVAESLDSVFGTGVGKIIAGIGMMTVAARALSVGFGGTVAALLLIVGLLDEVFSLFTEGRIGILEKILGKDLNLMSESSPWIKGLVMIVTTLGTLYTVLKLLKSLNPFSLLGKLLGWGDEEGGKSKGKGGGRGRGVAKGLGKRATSLGSRALPMLAGIPALPAVAVGATVAGGAYLYDKQMQANEASRTAGERIGRAAVANRKASSGTTVRNNVTVHAKTEVINAEGMTQQELSRAYEDSFRGIMQEEFGSIALQATLGE